MSILFRNNAVSTLASGAHITDTAIVVKPGEGSRFPNPGPGQYFIITVQNGAAFEIMHCTARSNDMMTVVRAREGTLAQPWAADSSVTMRITAGCLNALAQQEQVDAELANRALLTGATFSGDVTVAKATPGLILNKTASGQAALVLGRTAGSNRWAVELGDAGTEGGGNAGSNLVVRRYDNSGTQLGAPVVINRASGAMTLEAPLTLPASDPSNPNHATRKGYVDAGDVWVRLADAAVTNSTIIDLTGFSLQDYRQITVMLLGARLSSASSSNMAGRLFRNGSLVTTGYFFVRETAASTTMTIATDNNGSQLGLTLNGVNNNPLMIALGIVQPQSAGDVLIHAHVQYRDNANGDISNFRASCFVNGGTGWTNGFRIIAPVAFQNNVGRVVVLGLKP
jgi:hypothetical protein